MATTADPPATDQLKNNAPQNGQLPQDGTTYKERRIQCFQIFYTHERVTNITLTYTNGDKKSHNKDTPTHTTVEKLDLADGEDIVSIWLGRGGNGGQIHQLLLGTSYGRVTKLCGATSSPEELKLIHYDDKAVSGISSSDDGEIFEWDLHSKGVRIDMVMTTLALSISSYEASFETSKSSTSESSSAVGLDTGLYTKLLDAIVIVVQHFIENIGTLKVLAQELETFKSPTVDEADKDAPAPTVDKVNKTAPALMLPRHIEQTIEFYTIECKRQQQDIFNRFEYLFSVIEDTRARSQTQRIQIFEELVAVSKIGIASSNLKQWRTRTMACKDKLVSGLQARVQAAEEHHDRMQKLYTESSTAHCLCTESLVVHDLEAAERAQMAYTHIKARLETAVKERERQEAGFEMLLQRATKWEMEVKAQETTIKETIRRTGGLPALSPPDEDAKTADVFLEGMKTIWGAAAAVLEIRGYLMDETRQKIFKTIEVATIKWVEVQLTFKAALGGGVEYTEVSRSDSSARRDEFSTADAFQYRSNGDTESN